jgi:hypothetical protein
VAPHPSRLLPSTLQTSCRREPLLFPGRASLISLLRPFSKLPSSQYLRLGFITYGPQDCCDGSPVFLNRFFALSAINELKDDPSKLAMGRTVTGGSLGMAALEGYAAAIEVLVFSLYS